MGDDFDQSFALFTSGVKSCSQKQLCGGRRRMWDVGDDCIYRACSEA